MGATVTRMPGSRKDMSHPLELNQELRELIEVVRTADLNGADLVGPIAQVRALRADLEPLVLPGVRMQAALAYDDSNLDAPSLQEPLEKTGELLAEASLGADNPSDFFPYSPLVGLLNPISPPATMRRVPVDNGFEIHGEVMFSTAFNGPPGCVHGGAVAALFDELLGCACVVNGIGGFTGTLTVVYRTPTPLGTSLTLRGWHDRSEGRRVFAKGTLHDGDTLCARAEGIFVQSRSLPNPIG